MNYKDLLIGSYEVNSEYSADYMSKEEGVEKFRGKVHVLGHSLFDRSTFWLLIKLQPVGIVKF